LVILSSIDPFTFFFYQALAARGLKSGGTVQQRAERLFLLKVILKY
jgi:hypothetical protein